MGAHTTRTNFISGTAFSARRCLLASSALTIVALVALSPAPGMAETAPWSDFTSEHGSISIDTAAPGRTAIDQHTQVYIGTSGHLSIPEGYTVDIRQNNASALFAAKSANGADPTRILGALRANGNVLVIDPNGVYFGSNSQVDVGGIVATTGAIGNDQIAGRPFGQYTIDKIGQNPDARIELHGRVNVADAGLAAFVAPTVKNAGVISARLGKVAFASGERVTLDPYGDRLFEIEVPGKIAALIENTGTVAAEGGTVRMSAATASGVVDNLINVKGIVTAASVTQKGGKIILSAAGGKTRVSGRLDASGTSGGKVEIKGKTVVLDEGSEISANAGANGDGGHIAVWGDSAAVMGGAASARGGSVSGKGGFVELSAAEGVGFNGLVDTSAAGGETGIFLVDPETINLGDFSLFDFGTLTNLKIDDQALANTLRFSNVHLWATNRIYTSSDFDISTWQGLIPSSKGITGNDLTLSANTIDILHDITLGNGSLILRDALTTDSVFGFGLITPPSDITLETVNLGARILARSGVGGAASTAADSRIEGTAGTVNVLSPGALINQAVELVRAGGLIKVAAGTYNESVTVDKAATLRGATGFSSIVKPNSPGFHITADNVTVNGFAIDDASGVDGYGVWVDGADNARVINNLITDSASSGVRVSGSADNALVRNNRIRRSGRDGVEISNHGDDAVITGNVISTAGRYGISAEEDARLLIAGNRVSHIVRDGIRAERSPDVEILRNRVYDAGDSGIEVSRSPGVLVADNTVRQTGGDGLQISGSDNAVVRHNRTTRTIGDGLQIKGASGALVSGNEFLHAGDDGIDIDTMSSSTFARNRIVDVGDKGVSVKTSDLISIVGNRIFGAINAGVFADPSTRIDVRGNRLAGSAFGVFFDGTQNSSIGGNNVIRNNGTGVFLQGVSDIDVFGNTIRNNRAYGLLAGGRNGYISVSDNDFTDNPVHAKFESGLIDLTGVGNRFLNGDIALLFSPAGDGESAPLFTALALVDDDAPGYDTFPGTLKPVNYGGTIGAQFFSGQKTAFVKLENNAFLAPATFEGIWLNGLNSTYDGTLAGLGLIQPFATAGALTQGQFDFLESMFIHYPDTFGSTGRFFFGLVPSSSSSLSGLDNIEDFFRKFGFFNPSVSGLSVTITGLPSVGFGMNAMTTFSAPVSQPGPQNLASIEPAAGDDAGAGSQQAQNQAGLNEIEPATGGEQPCWSDVINAVGAGGPVNYSFGGTSEEDLEDTAACGAPE